MRRKRLLHLGLLPLYLGAATAVVTFATNVSLRNAALAGGIVASSAILPTAIVIYGCLKASRRLLRLALLITGIEILALGWIYSPSRSADFSATKLDPIKTSARLRHAAQIAFPNTLNYAKSIAAKGSRQTGSKGLEQTLAFAQDHLAQCGWNKSISGQVENLSQSPPEKTARRTDFSVLTPEDLGSRIELPDTGQTIAAYALLPNCVQPCATPLEGLSAPLVYLGFGRDEDLDGKEIYGKIAVFEFASDDRWLWAYEQGALGAIFLAAPDGVGETVRQADQKYLALVPLSFPRVYAQESEQLRDAARRNTRGVLHSRMTLKTVSTPVLEAFIPGARSAREILIMCHADARAIAPALSFGGQETFSLGAWLALFDYYSKNPPGFSLRFVLNTGHWQSQAVGRAYAYAIKDAIGSKIAMAIGVDLNPETNALIITDETVADTVWRPNYYWLKKLLFTVDRNEPGWLDQIESLSDRVVLDRGGAPSKYQFFGGRPTMPGALWMAWLAPINQWPPCSHSASHPTANQMITQVGGLSIALQTCNTYRQTHFTCRDRLELWLDRAENLQPQLEQTFALIGAIADIDPEHFPICQAFPYRDIGGYNTVEAQVLRWNKNILWYEKKMPTATRVFVLLAPINSLFLPGRSNAYWPCPLAPSRFRHRLLQSFQTVYISEVDANGRARFDNVYCPGAHINYDALALALDENGRVRYAFDQGFHGDAEFHFLDRNLTASRMLLQIPIFECGALVISSLLDRDRSNVNRPATFEYRARYMPGGDQQDEGEMPFIPITSVNEAATHTVADSYSWMQYQQTAMIFLKPDQPYEILAGHIHQKNLIFNDDSPLTQTRQQLKNSECAGYRVAVGEERRLNDPLRLSFQQLSQITRKRLDAYAALNVKSPTAKWHQARADAREKEALEHVASRQLAAANTTFALALSRQSSAYRHTFRLLMDVVTTTIFYFLLLLPFGYLVERLLFPQPTLLRTCIVAALIFILFTALLYVFHPGLHLTSNIFVTIITFAIVILTVPALMIIVSRGLALMMAPGERFKRRHAADSERWGVVSAALSLAINNMRRRKLRTGLTLATITLLVASLVLLTSATADTQFFREKQTVAVAPYHGAQVFNTRDYTHGMSEASVRIIESRYRHVAQIVARRYFTPGYNLSIPCFIAPNDYQFTVRGAISIDPIEAQISKLNQALVAGRFFETNDVRVCMLSADLARRQKLSVGDTLRFLGVELKLIGLLDQTIVNSQIVDISGKPITPQIFYRPSLSVENPDHLLANETIFVPAALTRDDIPAPFPAFTVVLMPNRPSSEQVAAQATTLRAWLDEAHCETLGTLEERVIRASQNTLDATEAKRLVALAESSSSSSNAELMELATRHLERRAIKKIAEEIASDIGNVDVFMTIPAAAWIADSKDCVECLSAQARVSLKSSSFLILPFIVSFFMLLAIMLGNVYERKNEIHVFSSVGLSPRHVAGMFLAEALVYAGIASVLGYFFGIILLDLFRRAEWLPADFNPNYFGKVVIWSAALATSASLLSVLYPMRIASRMVNPSLERIWRIETNPIGDDWMISLPFVVNDHNELIGILQFAREFLEHHYGERTGAFAIESYPFLGKQNDLPVLQATIWLSPFERNLVQTIALAPRHDVKKERYHLDLQTHRLSGPDYLWRKSNHAFVDGLRKQLLIWRSLRNELTQEYIAAGNAALFKIKN